MLETVDVDLDDLNLYYRNPRVGNVDVIAESLDTSGQYRAIVVNRGTRTGRPMEVLAGNHTVKAARSLGWSKITAHILDVDDEQASRILLADNRTAELGEMDDSILFQVMDELDDLIGTGYTDEDLDLLRLDADNELLIDEDELPEPTGESRVKVGDIWQLGAHRVVCGDSTSPEVFEALLDGEVADCIWTDPPYGVEYKGRTKRELTIHNDDEAGLAALLWDVFSLLYENVRQGAPMYVAYPARGRVTFEVNITGVGFDVRQELMWVKNRMVMGMSDYHYSHEGVLYGFKPAPKGSGFLGRRGSQWYGGDTRVSVFEAADALIAAWEGEGEDAILLLNPDKLMIALDEAVNSTSVFRHPKPAASRQHPTMKPVALITDMLRNSARKNEIVIDPFGGSGSTLIAAEVLGMRARLVELDPGFVEVILSRWEEASGLTAERVGKVKM